MSDKTELAALRNQIAEVIQKNPAPKMTREDREIALFEDDLREAGLNLRVDMAFGELDESLASVVFNSEHNFLGRDYILVWDRPTPQSKSYHLLVLNHKSTGMRRLSECPLAMKTQLLPFLHTFAVKVSSKLEVDS